MTLHTFTTGLEGRETQAERERGRGEKQRKGDIESTKIENKIITYLFSCATPIFIFAFFSSANHDFFYPPLLLLSRPSLYISVPNSVPSFYPSLSFSLCILQYTICKFIILHFRICNVQFTIYFQNLHLQFKIYIFTSCIFLISYIQFAICNIRICNRAGGMSMSIGHGMGTGRGMEHWRKGIF